MNGSRPDGRLGGPPMVNGDRISNPYALFALFLVTVAGTIPHDLGTHAPINAFAIINAAAFGVVFIAMLASLVMRSARVFDASVLSLAGLYFIAAFLYAIAANALSGSVRIALVLVSFGVAFGCLAWALRERT